MFEGPHKGHPSNPFFRFRPEISAVLANFLNIFPPIIESEEKYEDGIVPISQSELIALRETNISKEISLFAKPLPFKPQDIYRATNKVRAWHKNSTQPKKIVDLPFLDNYGQIAPKHKVSDNPLINQLLLMHVAFQQTYQKELIHGAIKRDDKRCSPEEVATKVIQHYMSSIDSPNLQLGLFNSLFLGDIPARFLISESASLNIARLHLEHWERYRNGLLQRDLPLTDWSRYGSILLEQEEGFQSPMEPQQTIQESDATKLEDTGVTAMIWKGPINQLGLVFRRLFSSGLIEEKGIGIKEKTRLLLLYWESSSGKLISSSIEKELSSSRNSSPTFEMRIPILKRKGNVSYQLSKDHRRLVWRGTPKQVVYIFRKLEELGCISSPDIPFFIQQSFFWKEEQNEFDLDHLRGEWKTLDCDSEDFDNYVILRPF